MIRTILEVTTGHLCPATCKQLDAWSGLIDFSNPVTPIRCRPGWPARAKIDTELLPVVMAGTEFGWLVWCAGAASLTADGVIPADLLTCLAVGDRFGVDFVLFDAEADECDAMPWGGGPKGDTERET